MACCRSEENGRRIKQARGVVGLRDVGETAAPSTLKNVENPTYTIAGVKHGATLQERLEFFVPLYVFLFLPLTCYQASLYVQVCRHVGVAPHPFLAPAPDSPLISDAFWVTESLSCILPVHPDRSAHFRQSLISPDLL